MSESTLARRQESNLNDPCYELERTSDFRTQEPENETEKRGDVLRLEVANKVGSNLKEQLEITLYIVAVYPNRKVIYLKGEIM